MAIATVLPIDVGPNNVDCDGDAGDGDDDAATRSTSQGCSSIRMPCWTGVIPRLVTGSCVVYVTPNRSKPKRRHDGYAFVGAGQAPSNVLSAPRLRIFLCGDGVDWARAYPFNVLYHLGSRFPINNVLVVLATHSIG